MSAILRVITWPLAWVVGWLVNRTGEVIDKGNEEFLLLLEEDGDES